MSVCLLGGRDESESYIQAAYAWLWLVAQSVTIRSLPSPCAAAGAPVLRRCRCRFRFRFRYYCYCHRPVYHLGISVRYIGRKEEGGRGEGGGQHCLTGHLTPTTPSCSTSTYLQICARYHPPIEVYDGELAAADAGLDPALVNERVGGRCECTVVSVLS
jgi:hypothetical protein